MVIVCNQVFFCFSAAKEFFNSFTQANVTMEMHEVSLLWYMWYVKTCGGSKRIWEVENGGQVNQMILPLYTHGMVTLVDKTHTKFEYN